MEGVPAGSHHGECDERLEPQHGDPDQQDHRREHEQQPPGRERVAVAV